MVEYKCVKDNGAIIWKPIGKAEVGEIIKVSIKNISLKPLQVHIEAIWSKPGVPSATLLLNKTYTLNPGELREHKIECTRAGVISIKLMFREVGLGWWNVHKMRIEVVEKKEIINIGKYIIIGGIALTGIAAVLSALRGD